jgi:hypothetical protein
MVVLDPTKAYLIMLGAPHGFVFFPLGGTPETQKALNDIKMFLDEHM